MSTWHTGRPVLRSAGDGGVTFLCPHGHLVHHVPPDEWAGSIWEAHAGDPRYTVTCAGALPCAGS